MAHSLYDIRPLETLIEQGYTLLTPNFRLARRIKAEWDAGQAAAGARVWQAISVLPLEAWLQQQWEHAVRANAVPPMTPLSTHQSLEVWRQVISEQQHAAADFQLLRPAAAAELAAQARDTLLRWCLDPQSRQLRPLFEMDADCSAFLRWLTAFEQRLAECHQCTAIDCLARLPQLDAVLPSSRVVLVEIEQLTPLQEAALQALCADIRHTRAEHRGEQRLLHPFADKRAELQAVARWAAGLHRDAPHTTIGIVLSDMANDRVALEYLLRREFDCLGRNYASLPVNFSTGISLDQAPLVRDALAALAMGLRQTTLTAVEKLLGSRFLDLPDAQSAVAQRLVRRLYAQGRADLVVSDLRDQAMAIQWGEATGTTLGRRLDALLAMPVLRRKALPSVWASRFCDMLGIWGWPGTQPLDSLEFQQLTRWQDTLAEFAAFDAVSKSLSLSEALALLRDCCRRQVSQPLTADSTVQVLGPLEAAGLSFDQLWVCGMQGGGWPASANPNPFIPIALQRQQLMPHASPEREWAFSDALLQQYARANRVFHASYSREVDGVPEPPSALLRDFTLHEMSDPPAIPDGWLERHCRRSVEAVPDDRATPLGLDSESAVRGGSGLLEDQSQCPFRAFARHRLQVEPLGTISVALPPGERGALLHEALNMLWGELGNSESLLALDDTAQARIVENAARAAIASIPRRQQRRLGRAYWRLEQQRIIALLDEWLGVERQRSAFVVAGRECEMSLELGQLHVRLRLDRIDQLSDGSHVIIDYKSGQCSVQDWMGHRPAQPQLLLYSMVEPDTLAGLAFASIRPRECRFVGLGRAGIAPGIRDDLDRVVDSAMAVSGWPQLQRYWENTLQRLAHEFVTGYAPVDPVTAASCTWCGLQALCRIGEAAAPAPESRA
ncbi:MAG: PD-(D/E)XK nuclease family protein [Halioglobus sp.]|nr:PD-(D/E)XK nuclease family protein [Halioglobus sp.]